ncbi:hypothetical protein BD779DRAFT_490740 [Infundibulicybe gibba]|nr:hypothetical protein BD779DRAFT_490740 [Infundibulicybe gibba]
MTFMHALLLLSENALINLPPDPGFGVFAGQLLCNCTCGDGSFEIGCSSFPAPASQSRAVTQASATFHVGPRPSTLSVHFIAATTEGSPRGSQVDSLRDSTSNVIHRRRVASFLVGKTNTMFTKSPAIMQHECSLGRENINIRRARLQARHWRDLWGCGEVFCGGC